MFILILISHYFPTNKFNIMKGNVYQTKLDLQRSGYSMEYHGNHYNIQNECFLYSVFFFCFFFFLHQEGPMSLILLNFAHAT